MTGCSRHKPTVAGKVRRGGRLIKRLVFFAGLSGFLAFAGCGYSLSHRLKDTFSNSKGIYVPSFINQTDQTGAERVFTNAVVRELASRKEVILSDRQQGALELEGTILVIDAAPTTFTELGFKGLQSYKRLPTEYGVRVTLGFVLKEVGSERVLWMKELTAFRRINAPLGRTHDFEATSSVGLASQTIIESLYDDVAKNLSRDLYDEMVEWF